MENQAAAEVEALNNNHNDLIDTFSEITSSSKEEALFFLESHNFDLDSAVSTFLETTPATTTTAAAVRNHSPSLSPSPATSLESSPSRSRSSSPPSSQPRNLYNLRSKQPKHSSNDKNPSGSRRSGRIRTFSDLNRMDGNDSDSDSDEHQEYYTGGEKSGMLVQDPSKGNGVDTLFDQARRAGAVEATADHLRPSSSSRSFSGSARLLSGETVPSTPLHLEAVTRNITFWTNGFTVDDGPLRRLDDPENASFLKSISKSECPEELKPADRRTKVHVNLMRRVGDCPTSKKPRLTFQGVGRTLASTDNAVPPMEPTVAVSNFNTLPPPSRGLVVDQMLPSTSIQLRLTDGTRMVSRFNHHHTIRDIRGFLDASRPAAPRTYQLLTMGFPPKQLEDLDQTIEQAGLANSVVIQKL